MKSIWNQIIAWPWRNLCNLTVLIGVASLSLTVAVRAETEYTVVPSASIFGLYDDNIFSTATGKESDYIIRVTPTLDLEFESSRVKMNGQLGVDAENYRQHSELNSNSVRRRADLAMEYLPHDRLTLIADAEYVKTETPEDLSLLPGSQVQGLQLGRAEAVRTLMRAASRYRMTSTLNGAIGYTRTHDRLAGSIEYKIDTVDMDIEKRISPASAFTSGFIHRKYRFRNTPSSSSATSSSTPWLGLKYRRNIATSAVGRAGARYSSDSTDPYVLVAVRHEYPAGEILAEYERNETALPGLGVRQETETLSLVMTRKFGERLEFRAAPTYARLLTIPGKPEIYNFALEGTYRVSEAVSITFGHVYSRQHVALSGGAASRISRNVFQLGITIAYPRRKREEDEPFNHEYRKHLDELGFSTTPDR